MDIPQPKTSSRSKLNHFFGGPNLPDRVSRVHNSLDLGSKILEISPNWAPLVLSEDLLPGGQIQYCDRMPTSWLKDRETDNPARLKFDLEVMHSDFDWTPGLKLDECTNLKFDYVISSHVVEHVPDFLGHMIEISSVLKEDGRYVFVIPNGRGTGEFFRRLSEESDVVEHYFMGGSRTSPGQNWDYLQNAVKWDGTPMFGRQKSDFVRHHTDAEAIQDAARCFKEYVDVHSWVFNRHSFLRIIAKFNQLNLFPFAVFDFQESSVRTPDGEPFEFIVTLRKCQYSIPPSWLEIVLERHSQLGVSSLFPEKPKLKVLPESFDSQIIERDKEILELRMSFSEIQKNLNVILTSKSWRVTKPLRRIRDFLNF
jgi:SAM-dependent methyltransferase